MKNEKCSGAVVFARNGEETRFAMVRESDGHWSFPKGHVEAGETDEETALREIREETGLDVRLVSGFREEESHPLAREGRPDTIKTVVYFLAEAQMDALAACDETEISRTAWLTLEEAAANLSSTRRQEILFLAGKQIEMMYRVK